MLNPNWLATTLSLFLMIVNIVKRNDYEWFHDNSAVLNLSALLTISTSRINSEHDLPYALVIITLNVISLIIHIKNIRIYRKIDTMLELPIKELEKISKKINNLLKHDHGDA